MLADQDQEVGGKLRALLAGILERSPAEVAALPGDTPLFGSGISLDSLTGLELLTAIKAEFGVDIASDDLNLDSLETIDTLTQYIGANARGAGDRIK